MTQAPEIPATAAEARNRVHDLLHAHPEPLDEVMLIDALLITSELVTNARRHAGGVTAFATRITGNRLEIRVEDPSPRHPANTSRNSPGDIGGYGWPMVCQLATSIDIAPTSQGKAITVVLQLR
ncbi:ATP-binding protein [Streptomyces lydicus]|uniref:ATP-binding protein n=1 Tax=Streptomyces lydicus TaxID=47763 RepID=UPI0007C49BA6|nr:ATP-binding protein [Streptomyces lydicus]MDC7335334.1 ATP-binding protein [Streptomyces lydicus]